MMKLEDCNDQTLRDELTRRKEDREKVEFNRRRDQASLMMKHIDTLIELVSEHARDNCSDAAIINDGLCLRCTLLMAKIREYIDPDYEVVLTLRNHAR